MKTNEVMCPNCGKALQDYQGAEVSFCCRQPVYPWQALMHGFFDKATGKILLAYVLLQYVGASLLQGRLYVPFVNGFVTDGAGIVIPAILFYVAVVVIRRIDMALRFLCPGPPVQWKLNLIAVLNMALYLLLIVLAVRFCQARGLLWGGPAGDSVSTVVRYQSGLPVINAGHGAFLLALPGFVMLMLAGWGAEVLKVLRRIYPAPGFPDIL